MLRAYKHNENHILCEVPLEQLEKGSWINCAAPDTAELNKLNELTGIPVDSLQTALDREERSHVELEDDYIFVVVNTPVVLETDAYDALPLGIFITRQYFVTVCLETNSVIQKFLNNSFTSFQTYKKTRFLFQILYKSATLYLKYIRNIIRRTDDLEHHLRRAMENSKLFSMLDLQKSLTYFTTSLKSNYMVTEKLLRLRSVSSQPNPVKMYEEDEDLLEDVIVEYKQAIEMVEMYSRIVNSTMEVFASIISNNLNLVMRFLASVTIILAIPTLFFSLWGMNVPVPFAENPFGFWLVIAISVLFSAAAAAALWKHHMF